LQIYRPAAAGKDIRHVWGKSGIRRRTRGILSAFLNFTLYGFRGRTPLLIDAYILIARSHKQSALCRVNFKAAPEFIRAPQLKI